MIPRTSRDVVQFCVMEGVHTPRGISVVGVKCVGTPSKSIHALRHAFTTLFGTRYLSTKQHLLYFLPLPQGHLSFFPILPFGLRFLALAILS
jgi:Udp N-acetylglucosamine O-acyltransferase